MTLPPWLENTLERGCDFYFRHWPQPFPDPQLLRECRIIAHRGAPTPPDILENTHAAFEQALSHPGVKGLEFDVRWTQDLQPVVSHDADLLRLYGDARRIGKEAQRRHGIKEPGLRWVVSAPRLRCDACPKDAHRAAHRA